MDGPKACFVSVAAVTPVALHDGQRCRSQRGGLASQSLDPVFLVDGDFARQWQARIEAQMCDRDERVVRHIGAEIEFAENAAFIAHVVQQRDRGERWND